MTFNHKQQQLMSDQIDSAWEVLMDAKKNNGQFKMFLQENFGDNMAIQWGLISLEGEMESVFDYMLENYWEATMENPVRAFRINLMDILGELGEDAEYQQELIREGGI